MDLNKIFEAIKNLAFRTEEKGINSQIEELSRRQTDLQDYNNGAQNVLSHTESQLNSLPYLQQKAREGGYVPAQGIPLDQLAQHMESMSNAPKFRNPMMNQWLNSPNRAQTNQNPIKSDEFLSGVNIAANEYGVPKDLLTDIGGLESMAGFYDRPINSTPGQYDNETNARGPFMFLQGTAKSEGLAPNDRYSATESARATARKLKKGQLGEWDITDKPGAGGGKLTDWYSPEELDPYSFNSLKRRAMLQSLASTR